MKYNTREIINRALSLTDFSTDFFMGNTELTNLLNDCYTECYDLLVNNGDKTFIKQTDISNGQSLPTDFYRLLEVKHRKEYLLKDQDYDIINNKFILHNEYQTATIYYYPQPKTLSLKANDSAELAYDNVVTLWQDGYVLPDSLIDDSGNTIVSFTNTPNTYLRNGYIYNNTIYDYSNNAFEEIKLIVGNEITYDNVKITLNTDITPIAVITNSDRSFYYILDNNSNLYNEDEEIVYQSFSPTTIYCKDDGLYFISAGRLRKILGSIVEEFPNSYTIRGILDENYMSATLGSTIRKKGYGIDTVLEVPNSTFWTYFAYSIAISICNVVQRDSSTLEKKYSTVREQFLQSLIYDTNSAYTVRNVEGSRQWL